MCRYYLKGYLAACEIAKNKFAKMCGIARVTYINFLNGKKIKPATFEKIKQGFKKLSGNDLDEIMQRYGLHTN